MPSILLLSGGTGVGTSSIAMRVAADPSIQVRSVIGSDALREVVRQFVSSTEYPELSYSSYDGYIPSGDSAQLINAYRRQAQVIGIGIAAIIRRAVQENIRLIVEGVHIAPEPIHAHLTRLEALEVVQIHIDIQSSAIHRERLERRAEFAPNRDVTRQLANFERIRQIRSYLLDVAQMNRLPVVFNDDSDISKAVAECVAIYRGQR